MKWSIIVSSLYCFSKKRLLGYTILEAMEYLGKVYFINGLPRHIKYTITDYTRSNICIYFKAQTYVLF